MFEIRMNKKHLAALRRFGAGFLAVTLFMSVIFSRGGLLFPSQAAEGEMTGLKLYWTDIPDMDGEFFYWPRKCYFTGGTGKYAAMANNYAYCIANHAGQPDMGAEAFVLNELTIDEYGSFHGNDMAESEYTPEKAEELSKFTFCLAAAAAVGIGHYSLANLQNPYSATERYIMAQSVFLAIEGRMADSARITEINRDHCMAAYKKAMDLEFASDQMRNIMGKERMLHPDIRSALIAVREVYFNQVYDAAIVMYNAIQSTEGGIAANSMTAAVDPDDPSVYVMTAPCYGEERIYTNYYSKITVTSPAWSIAEKKFDGTNAIIKFKGPAGVDIASEGISFRLPRSSYITDLSKPLLYEFDFKTPNQDGGYQVMFCAIRGENPTITVGGSGASAPSSPGGGSSGGGGGEGSIDLEIHRYKHTETWTSTYNVDLIKLDSETGKPLSGSEWDILEYDTLDSQLDDTYLDYTGGGEKYNWANDNGSQFTRWDGEDPCARDRNITGDDGYLYEANTVGHMTGTKAHMDTYNYTYTKGYCDGHPEPVVTEYECTHEEEEGEGDGEGGEEEECDCEEKNEELRQKAQEAWQEQVDYCEQLASEGGFFHSMDSGSAKTALQRDRDEFYKDFISLTYDYSAVETGARSGYILHGKHTDDIPIERVTVHSSQYLAGGARSRMAEPISMDEELTQDETDAILDARVTRSVREVQVVGVEAEVSTPSDASDEHLYGFVGQDTGIEGDNGDDDSDNDDDLDSDLFDGEGDHDLEEDDEDYEEELLSDASASNALVDEIEIRREPAFNRLKEAIASLFDVRLRGARAGAARNSAPPTTDGVAYIGAVNFENSSVSPHSKGSSSEECWTFIAYDHRTEGEIHFNKRDLDLKQNEMAGVFDAYAVENGDGSLEGAVYGLFALKDIVHPDSNGKTNSGNDTGTVYKAGDLVAVATTDRDGNASFMTFTEAPGRTYNYETGKIEQRTDISWTGPSNLHTSKGAADSVNDNERFKGWNDAGSARVSLTDSQAVDGTVYRKHSSNQGKTYPISNNVGNNGNYWIGRPLIVSGVNTANYYIKELSRSEGYELSVYGKDMNLTNREAFENGGAVTAEGEVGFGTMGITQQIAGGGIESYNDITVTGAGTVHGFDAIFKNLTQNADLADFYLYQTQIVEQPQEITKDVSVVKPLMAEPGSTVIINGARVEATLGATITLPNGSSATVMNTMTESGDKLFVTSNSLAYTLPAADDVNDAEGANLFAKYNKALAASGFAVPDTKAPWVLVEKGLLNADEEELTDEEKQALIDQRSFNNLTTVLQGYTGFHQMRIVAETTTHYVVQYSYKDAPTALYDITNQILWIKKAVQVDGSDAYIYARYDASVLTHNGTGFVVNDQIPDQTTFTKYEDLSGVTYTDAPGKTYWTYADDEQMLDDDGTPMTYVETVQETVTENVQVAVDIETPIDPSKISYNAATNTYTVRFDAEGTYKLRIRYQTESTNGVVNASYAKSHALLGYYISPQVAGSYIVDVPLDYPGASGLISDFGSNQMPVALEERPVRQKIRVNKAIETLGTEKRVWYCLDCGLENGEMTANCAYCNKQHTTEEVRIIVYEDDTYGAVHKNNLSVKREGGVFTSVKDWLAGLLDGTHNNGGEEAGTDISGFRFKAYLKSNLERLYRTADGMVTFLDRNGNSMTPQYKDTNGDGNYDTFTWKYDSAFGGKSVDFPEKDEMGAEEVLQSANVQKIYTKVDHQTSSKTTSDRANNVWDTYRSPQEGYTENVGERTGYTTSLRDDVPSGKAVSANAALYSYKGVNTDKNQTERILANANTGYTRVLETTVKTLENGTSSVKVEQYNYEKFFDAIDVSNTDKWDDDMHSSKENYPGQKWLETFREKYQKDDTDVDHTLANTDGVDADGTAGGDRNTSFKPFMWITEALFGSRADYEKYPAEANGVNVENKVNTSEYAHMNAKASDAVRQFAVKWYLEDEAAKLMKDNGNGENVAISGALSYDEEIYDEALMNAIAKTYDYLIPFFTYDLDTIYSVEWDGDAYGGADKDYTTLTANKDHAEEHYNLSAYLPYGTYVITELTPGWVDGTVNEYRNRSYLTGDVKEVTLPSLYDAEEANAYADNFDPHYVYAYGMNPQEQAKESNFLIRFAEEWGDGNTQSLDEYVIHAHGYYGDFEVYKYGLDIDRLTGAGYAGWKLSQSLNDPLKDYYKPDHAAGNGNGAIGAVLGGHADSGYLAFSTGSTANGSTYHGKELADRYFYGSVSEDAGMADQVIFTGGASNDNNPNGMYLKNDVRTMTGELTAYDGLYSAALVPWTVTAPTSLDAYDSDDFSGYADVNEQNTFYSARLRINKVDADTGEYILHDDAIFALYATSRYMSFDEIAADANLIPDAAEKAMFLDQFKPGDTKFYLEDTLIEGSREFLEAMGAENLQPMAKGVQSGVGVGARFTGTVKKGTPVCVESERIIMTDYFGERTGQMTAFTTLNDVYVEKEDGSGMGYVNQNTGYLVTPQPVGAGTYGLLEIKAPDGYARSKPVCYEVYADRTSYYANGDMYSRVTALRTEQNLVTDILYN